MFKVRIIYLLIGLMFFTSCNPFTSKELRRKKKCNRKLERVIRKCPELLRTDTIIDTVIVEIPAIDIGTSIDIQADTIGLDSIFNSFKAQFLDSVSQVDLRNTIIKYIRTNPCTSDTIVSIIDGITFTAWFGNGQMHYRVQRPKKKKKQAVEVIAQTVTPIELTIGERILIWLGKFWWWVVIVGGICFILFRLLRFAWRTFVKK